MTNQMILTHVVIKNITEVAVNNGNNYSNYGDNTVLKIEFITNGIDEYTNNELQKQINVIFNFNYPHYQDIFEQIFLPYIEIDENNQYVIDNILEKEFLAIFHLKYNELYDNTFYLIKALISKEHAHSLLNEKKVGNNNE